MACTSEATLNCMIEDSNNSCLGFHCLISDNFPLTGSGSTECSSRLITVSTESPEMMEDILGVVV